MQWWNCPPCNCQLALNTLELSIFILGHGLDTCWIYQIYLLKREELSLAVYWLSFHENKSSIQHKILTSFGCFRYQPAATLVVSDINQQLQRLRSWSGLGGDHEMEEEERREVSAEQWRGSELSFWLSSAHRRLALKRTARPVTIENSEGLDCFSEKICEIHYK